MKSERMVDVVETHTEGQATRTVTGGINTAGLVGDSVAEKQDSFDQSFGWLLDFLAKEPRGHSNLVVNVPVPPSRDEADTGMLFFDNDDYLKNCGDGLIGSTTALMETGIIEPRGELTVEVPAGLVELRIDLSESNQVEEVGIQDMKSFVYDETTTTVATDDGDIEIPVDVAYGSNWFAFVDADMLEMSLDPGAADPDRIIDYGLQIREDLNERLDIVNPLIGESERIAITMFMEEGVAAPDTGTIVYAAGSIGRSPCGTGTSAQLARQYADGSLDIDEPYPILSMFDTQFTGRILDVEERDGVTVTSCEVAGSANVVAKNTYLQDPDDALQGISL